MSSFESLQTKMYIKSCLEEFPDQLYKRYGKKPEMEALEKKVRKLWNDNHKKITGEIIEAVQDKEGTYWDFQKFWFFPPGVDKAIEKFDPIEINPDRESHSEIAKKLFERLPWIEIVSVILRFVDPVRFGIISTPVEFVLWIQRGENPVETYDAYLKNLEEIKDKSGLKRIADVDMALMVHFFKLQDKDPEAKKYEKDPVLRKIRLQNIIDVLFRNYDDFVEIGESLTRLAGQEQTSHLAGLLLSVKFEEIVIKKAGDRGWKPKPRELQERDYSKLMDAAKHLEKEERYKELKLTERFGCIDTRNDFVHVDRRRDPAKLPLLINAINKLKEP